MERKRLIAIVIIVIIIVGVLGWYFLFWNQPGQQEEIKVFIDGKDYTIPLIWNFTNVNATIFESPLHSISNTDSNATIVTFTYTIWRYNASINQWTKVYNGTRWVGAGTQNAYTAFYSTANQTKFQQLVYATEKANDQSFYYFFLSHTDRMIYAKFQYLGGNPAVDSETVFANLYFDGNNNNALDAKDKAFNYTNNPYRTSINELKVYTPLTDSSWQFNQSISWNDIPQSPMPINISISSDRKNITWAVPFDYIGAKKNASIGFAFQAFGYNFIPEGASSTTPAKYAETQLSLPPPNISFRVDPQRIVNFFIRAWFGSSASGDYSFVYQATAQPQP